MLETQGNPDRAGQARIKAVLFDVGNTLLHLDYAWIAQQARALGGGASADDVGRATAVRRWALRRSRIEVVQVDSAAVRAAGLAGHRNSSPV